MSFPPSRTPEVARELVVMVTTPGRRASEKLARLLVDRKLAACANILPGVRSRYWWKGKVETAREELLLLKTHRSKWAALSRAIRENHPYATCEILALPVAAGNPAYLEWMAQSLEP